MAKVRRGILIGIVSFVIYFCTVWFNQYKPDSSLSGFPISNQVILLKDHDLGKSFQWSRASEEHGIPFDYEVALKLRGWEKGEREGAAVEYTKDNKVITLISTNETLDVLKTPLR